jgi:hypothetical protein
MPGEEVIRVASELERSMSQSQPFAENTTCSVTGEGAASIGPEFKTGKSCPSK